jgi:hypothetical protein
MKDGKFQKGQAPHNVSDLTNLVQVGQMFGQWCVVSSVVSRDAKGYRVIEVACLGCKGITTKHYDNLKAGKSSTCLTCAAETRRIIPKEYRWLERRYTAAKARCENANDPSYANYGGRGIRLCFASSTEYITYLLSLPGASRDKEIDRIDNNGNYEPGNLRWVDRATQSRNRRRNVYVEYKGQRMVLSDFVRDHTNISITKANKLLREGKSLEEIAAYIPKDVGRRAQSVRLGKLRSEAEIRSQSSKSNHST